MADPWAEFVPSKETAKDDPWSSFVPASPTLSESAVDAAKSIGTGIVKGATGLVGIGGDLQNLGQNAGASDFLTRKAQEYFPEATKWMMEQSKKTAERSPLASALSSGTGDIPAIGLPTSKQAQDVVEGVTGKLHEPTTGAGHAAETVASFVPGALAGGGSTATNLLRYALLPGAAVEGVGHAMEGNSWKPYAQAAAGIAAGAINPARLVTPLLIPPARRAMIDTLANEGVTSLTAGQRTGSEPLRYFESAVSAAPLAGAGAHRIQHEGQRQFTEAAVRRAGAGPDASPEVLGDNYRRLGQEFERLSARNNLVPDNRFITDVVDSVSRYRNVPESQQRAILQGYLDDLVPHVNAGHMPGTQYQPMRSMLSSDAKAVANSDPYLSRALAGIRNALDNAMNRSISPADQQAWATARQQYQAQKVLEKAASRAGEVTAEGQITPANLRNTVATENRGAYARGEGQFADLSRAGVGVMSPLPNSGTAQRHNIFSLLNAATGGIVPAVTGRAVMSQPVQRILANQLIHGALPTDETARALMVIEALQRPRQITDQRQQP